MLLPRLLKGCRILSTRVEVCGSEPIFPATSASEKAINGNNEQFRAKLKPFFKEVSELLTRRRCTFPRLCNFG